MTAPGFGRRALLAAPAVLAGRLPLAAEPVSRLSTPWWRQRHEAKLRERASRPVGLVWLGDSITQNFEKAGPPDWQDFAPIWQRAYAPRQGLNLGFKGDATCHLLWRLRNGEIDGIAPRLAIVLIGANNLGRLHWSAPDTLAGIAAVVAEARLRLPHARLLLLSVLPSRRSDWASATTAEINRGLADRYGTGAQGVTFLDVTGVFLHDGALDLGSFYDQRLTPPEPPLHPTAAAQARLVAFIEPTVARLIG